MGGGSEITDRLRGPLRGWRQRLVRAGMRRCAVMAGWCASVIEPGRVALGDAVAPA